MPGQKGESGKKPNPTGGGGAYAHSANSFGDAETNNIQGFNSMDGRQAQRGGSIKNSNGQYGEGNGGGGMPGPRDY